MHPKSSLEILSWALGVLKIVNRSSTRSQGEPRRAQEGQGGCLGGPSVQECNRSHQNEKLHGWVREDRWRTLGVSLKDGLCSRWGNLGDPWGSLERPWGSLESLGESLRILGGSLEVLVCALWTPCGSLRRSGGSFGEPRRVQGGQGKTKARPRKGKGRHRTHKCPRMY